jgi:hypothetical protein
MVKKLILATLPFILGSSTAACASVFAYKYFVLNLESQTLQGPTEKDDLPLSVCAQSIEGFQCVTLKIDEFYRLKENYEKQVKRIEQLERECGN